jgi:SWI/SNF-related matrix-associated actin-dependent regulator of chromatin subfamily A member 5
VNASARWGRDAVEEIAEEMEGKTIKEVRAYAEVFWDRYHELPSK